MWYNVDFDSWVKANVPLRFRFKENLSWLRALIAPCKYLYSLFLINRNVNIYDLGHNSQVCYLEALLNDTFDSELRRIYITDGAFFSPLYIYVRAEDKPQYLYTRAEEQPLTLYTRAESTSEGIQFIVNLPTDVTLSGIYSIHRLKALINKYRLASKNNYQINIF